ncbi:hypothetical protein MLD38_032854 [Melastoma candidum]|uniref:Uncharacterized protein n=1 Tax=Melastoma candidum TaxID=119954 RepID=A0ACB9M4Y4_9MYRT|nr:hypothetical protein MLD38_032854 [Melastoma candidum]
MGAKSANLWVLLGLGIAGIVLLTKKLKRVGEDFGAFVEKFRLLPPPQPAPPKAPHPLTALTFAVSDVFDVEGHVTGFGSLDWARTHEPATRTATVVSVLVEGGATCVGRTVVNEFAFGLSGENKHHGSPTNPAAQDRVPGGPCSGAAVVVAANLVDFSLGIDTVGGVRVPAAYCGILGFRSSHGAVSNVGILPISSSLDAVGWFAKDPDVLRRVGHVLLQIPFSAERNPRQMIIADDCFQLLKVPIDRVVQVVVKSTEKLYGRQVLRHENLGEFCRSKILSLKAFHNKKSNGDLKSSFLKDIAEIGQVLQREEFKQNHGDWIDEVKPALDSVISTQSSHLPEMADMEVENSILVRNELRSALSGLLKDDGILVIPTVADPPPKVGSKELHSEDFKGRASSLLSIASVSGCCQATLPLGYHDRCPVSVSFIARHGGDRFLLDTVRSMYATLIELAEISSKTKSSANTITREESAEQAKEKGNQAFKEKQWQKAIGFYTEAIKLNGTSATYYSNRAAVYLELGSFLQAEADCSKAINLDKKNVKAYLRRGTAREMLGYYKEAIEDFRYALVLEPTNKRASLSAERLGKLFQ